MKLDGKLFLPLFQEVRKVQETLKTYCLPGDSIPLPQDNLQYAIEQTYGVKIEVVTVPLGFSLLRGLFEKYPQKSKIYIDSELNSTWTRYVFAKEACHHLLDGEEFHTEDPTAVIEEIVLDESGINGADDPGLDVQSEILTKFAAIELLFPLEFRDSCKAEVNAEKKSTYEIAAHFDIPEHLVQFSLSDNYMKFSKRIWDDV